MIQTAARSGAALIQRVFFGPFPAGSVLEEVRFSGTSVMSQLYVAVAVLGAIQDTDGGFAASEQLIASDVTEGGSPSVELGSVAATPQQVDDVVFVFQHALDARATMVGVQVSMPSGFGSFVASVRVRPARGDGDGLTAPIPRDMPPSRGQTFSVGGSVAVPGGTYRP